MATVITNFFSAVPWIGGDLVEMIWGSFSVSNPTLNRFFSLHYLLPFILAALVCCHLIALHTNASNNPLGINFRTDAVRFHPYFVSKDLITVFIWIIALSLFVFYAPNYLGHSDNSIEANPQVTPHSIVPEWYFLPFYAILRAIPSKLGGVLTMFGAIVILFGLTIFQNNNIRSLKFKPVLRFLFWVFVFDFLFLLWLGAKPIAEPFVTLGRTATILYFLYFVLLFIIG